MREESISTHDQEDHHQEAITQDAETTHTTTHRSHRPTMISAKYRQKEERRKVLKLSVNKLKKIEDPESSLRRSVLINNTMRRLQREAREEKLHRHHSHSHHNHNNNNHQQHPRLADITNLPESNSNSRRSSSVSSDDVDESDVQAVLSQFYMPLTPRMVTSLDDLELEEETPPPPPEKRPRLQQPSTSQQPQQPRYSCGHSSMFNELQSVVYHSLIASLET